MLVAAGNADRVDLDTRVCFIFFRSDVDLSELDGVLPLNRNEPWTSSSNSSIVLPIFAALSDIGTESSSVLSTLLDFVKFIPFIIISFR